MSALAYRPEVDGLRTVAVIPVVVFHLVRGWLPGGFLGVDVFFVISGYLITSIILREVESGTFSFRKFWERRIRRIVPALSVMVLGTMLATYFFAFRGTRSTVAAHGLCALLSCANIYSWRQTGDYWGPRAEASPLLHTWSLSVEEQFYLLYPALLVLGLRFARRLVVPGLALVTVGSLGLFLFGATTHPEASFYLLPTRAWELGAGGLLAVFGGRLSNRWGVRTSSVASLTGLGLILSSYVLADQTTQVSALFVAPVLGAVLVIAGGDVGPVRSLLSLPPMVTIGKVSYSLYLWHWPVIVLMNSLGLSSPLLQVAIMAVLTAASYRLVEVPARAAKSLTRTAFSFSAAAAACVAVSLSPSQYDVTRFKQPLWRGQVYSVNPTLRMTAANAAIMQGVEMPPRRGFQEAYKTGGIIRPYGGPKPDLVVLGDSHAVMWSGLLDDVARDLGTTVSFYAMSGVDPFCEVPPRNESTLNLGGSWKHDYDTQRLAYLAEWKPKVVVIAARWSIKTLPQVLPLLEYVSRHGTNVLLIEQPPELGTGDVNVLQFLAFRGMTPEPGESRYLPEAGGERETASLLLSELCERFPNCRVVPLGGIYQGPERTVRVLDGADSVYLDDDHLTDYGTSLLRPVLERSLRDALEGAAESR